MPDTTETDETAEDWIQVKTTESFKQSARVNAAQRGYADLSKYIRGLIQADSEGRLTVENEEAEA